MGGHGGKEEEEMANANVKASLGDASLWDANDVARYLKVSRSWVYHRAELGLLPCLRIGALLRFEPTKVQAFALGHLAGTSTPTIPPTAAGQRESQPAPERR